MNGEIGVFLIAGNRLLREALARLLNKRTDIRLLGVDSFSPDIVSRVKASGPQVLLLDSTPSIIADLEFIRVVRSKVPNLKVIMIGMEEEEELFLRVVRAGVVGCVLKDASALEVVTAIRAVVRGEAVCPRRMCLWLFNYIARQWATRPLLQPKTNGGLTRREQQLLPLIAQGLTNKEIASVLNVSEHTVKNHIHHILQKVGVNDRLAATELLMKDRELVIPAEV